MQLLRLEDQKHSWAYQVSFLGHYKTRLSTETDKKYKDNETTHLPRIKNIVNILQKFLHYNLKKELKENNLRSTT